MICADVVCSGDTLRCFSYGSWAPRLKHGLQCFDLHQIDPANDRETVLAGPRAGLDKHDFFQELTQSLLDGGLPQLCMPLDRAFVTPNVRAVVARLPVGNKAFRRPSSLISRKRF